MYFLSAFVVDMCDQSWKSFVPQTEKILSRRSEILRVSEWHALYFRDEQ